MDKKLYWIHKEKVREEADNWLFHLASHEYSDEEIAEWREHFFKLGTRYGLITEFREKGVI